MRKIRLFIIGLTLSLIILLPAHAQEAFDIRNFQTDIKMRENGTMTVTETIDTDFTENRHGIFRDIQTEDIVIQILSVTDENGAGLPYKEIGFAEGTRLQIGDPDRTIIGRQVYKISYDVKKAIRFFSDHDELYWNATGNAWPVNIMSAVTTVTLPSSVKKTDVRMRCFTGSSGSTQEDCTYTFDEIKNEAVFRSNNPLPAYNGMTIVAGVPTSTFEHPTTLEVKSAPDGASVYLDGKYVCQTDCLDDSLPPGKYEMTLKKFGYKSPEPKTITLNEGESNLQSFDLKKHLWMYLLTLFLSVLALAVVFEPVYIFWKKGRDPKGRGVLVPQYEAPDMLAPSEVGSLVDEKADIRDLTCTIVDMAVRGYLVIKVLPDAKGFIFKKDDYELIKTDATELKGKRKELTAFESKFMDAVFGSKKSVKVSDLENEFYKNLPELKKALYQSLVDKEYFPKSPSSVRVTYFVKGFLFVFFGWFAISFEAIALHSIFSSAFIVNGILTLLLAYFMPKKTAKGVAAREYILGFKHYMEVAEKDRLKFQEKENIFYECLPYAMALNVADKWSKAFKDVFKNPPEWYQGAGTGHFYPIAFTHNIQSMASSMNSAFASHPSSSGGSGFGGGGFSGGGGGGGGGGSW